MGLPTAGTPGVAVANLENGTLQAPGWRNRMFAGTDLLWFQPGDRIFVEKSLTEDKVTDVQ